MSSRSSSTSDPEARRALSRADMRHLGRILVYLRPYRWRYLLGLLLLLVSSGVTLVFPAVTGQLVDAATGAATQYNRTTLALGLLGVLAVQALFSYLRVIVFAGAAASTLRDLRLAVYSRLVGLPMTFFEQRRVGELSSRLTADISQLQEVLTFALAELIRQLATLLVGVGIILMTSPRLTGVMLSTFPLMIIGAVVFGRYIRRLSRQVTDELAAASTVAEETLQGMATVKAFTNEHYEAGRYGTRLERVRALTLNTAAYRGLFVSFVIFSVFGGIVLVLWYGLGLVEQGELTIGNLVSFIIYTSFIGAAAGGLGDLYGQIQKTIGASERVGQILDEVVEVPVVPTRGQVLPRVSETSRSPLQPEPAMSGGPLGRVTFQGVHFRYPTRPDVPVLKGIDFELPAGGQLALVGQSGAGKSTIAQLLLGLHRPTAGRILIDGQDTALMDLSTWRSRMALVPQEVLLFGGTIEENIRYGRPDASPEAIREAAAKAHALEFIDHFPEGMQTIVGERGIKLSGGQRQRIAIARAILKDPDILILDEATNALDAASEAIVQKALQALMAGRTTLVIAHRLGTIRHADQILALEGGQIIEQGTHGELLKRPEGYYAGLVALSEELPGMNGPRLGQPETPTLAPPPTPVLTPR